VFPPRRAALRASRSDALISSRNVIQKHAKQATKDDAPGIGKSANESLRIANVIFCSI
jgi:hypothetical protein